MLIPIVGPSKAGKTETTRHLLANNILTCVDRIDLDEDLGPCSRGDGDAAIRIIEAHHVECSPRHRLVDVGAGQLISGGFQSYLRSCSGYPRSVVVIWCDEATFRQRHGSNADNEVGRYYGVSSLNSFWDAARACGHLVDTSGGYAPATWAGQLAGILRQILQD